ncbi:hypothetical protein Ctob_015460 [Chrysochromulina tobinii]|uniref:Uncharacterized protein n=1 Tax=Chrysochromulina tobinii TaxID=1460289 RepID=A0A0M0KBN9_9EUKA|nr:hypothetical protein Ctob_015460 [Chrysochromulina tobinii]|eukprot:KOO35977.1 hypothetical protein Ctob_015460 [Chrysochromulina sp. CCMP291]
MRQCEWSRHLEGSCQACRPRSIRYSQLWG